MKFMPLFCFAIFSLCGTIFAEEDVIQPQGIYKSIDTRLDMMAINLLRSGSDSDKEQVAEEVSGNSRKYCPAVFFPLAVYYFDKGRTDDALFWMYAGRIRTWYDIQRCTDPTVQDAAAELGMQLPDLLRLIQFEDFDKSRKILEKAIEWDRKTPHDYDPKWIALHGLEAFNPDPKKTVPEDLNIPKDKWDALAEENRDTYLRNYLEDMDAITPEQLNQIKDKIKELKGKK